jgi:hypothetical protein
MPSCPFGPNVSSMWCQSGQCAIQTCSANYFDVDSSGGNGCECLDQGEPQACGSTLNLGSVNIGGSTSYSGTLMPGQTDWIRVSFPSNRAGNNPGGGTPRIRLTGAGAGNVQVCGTPYGCSVEGGNSASVTDFEFTDNQAIPGVTQWSVQNEPWPQTVGIRVTRVAPATVCGDTSYTLTITR